MNRKELLFWMAAASTVNYVGRSAMAIAGPDIAKQFQFSEAQLGQIFAAFWLGYGLLMWPAGWLADRFGAARVLGLCGLLSAALLASNAALSTLAGFLLLRVLFGAASAALYPACGNLTLLHFPARSVAGVQGIVVGGSNLGAAIAPFLVLSVSAFWGWQGAFLATGALTLLTFLFWMRRLPMHQPHAEKPPQLLRLTRPLILLSLQSFCIGYVYSFTDSWSFYYFREVRHFANEQSALFTTLLQIAGGVMMPLGGWLSDLLAPRFGRMQPAFLALAASAVLLAASTAITSPLLVLLAITAAYGLIVATEGAFWWAVLTKSADSPGAAYGFANAVGSAAQFIAPILLPAIAARWGWDASLYSAAASLLLSAAFWRLARPA